MWHAYLEQSQLAICMCTSVLSAISYFSLSETQKTVLDIHIVSICTGTTDVHTCLHV